MSKVEQTVRKNEQYVIIAEYRLLNKVAQDQSVLDGGLIHEGLFPHDIAKSYYRAICQMHEANEPISAVSLTQKANQLDYAATTDVTDKILSIGDDQLNITECVDVLDKAIRKKAFSDTVDSIAYEANVFGEIDIDAIKSKLFDAEQLLVSNSGKSKLKSLKTWFTDYVEDFKARAKGRQYPFGDVLLDNALVKGAYPGAITTIAGGTGQGKSAYVLNLINQMINQQIPCIYISLEMSDVDTMDRLVSMRCEIPTSELYHPNDGFEALLALIEQEKKKLEHNENFYFSDDPDLSLSEIEAMIKEFKQRTKTNYCVVAIDLITQVKDFTKTQGGNLAQGIEQAMNKLNIIAKKQNVHFIAVAQFNRDADSAKVACVKDLEMLRPGLHSVKNAGAIAERSRAVLGVFRAKYYANRYLVDDPEAEYLEDVMSVQVLKQSNGSTPRIEYDFDGEVFRCTPIIKDPNEQSENEHMINY